MWYLRLNVKIFVLWPSGVFVLVHLHFSSHTLAHSRWTSVPARLNLNWQCQESKILKKDFHSVIGARKKNRKKKDRNKCLWDLLSRRNTSSLGWIQSEQRSIKGCSVWMSENTFDTLFLQWSDCVPGKKKPLYVHMTKQYSIADHIWPWNLPALQSCIHVSALRLQHIHLAFIYLSGLKSALSTPYTSQIEVSKIHRIWGAGRKKGNCK